MCQSRAIRDLRNFPPRLIVDPIAASPLFSVIVPVFDDQEGLRRCLEALDRQTLPKVRFEVIVVDNGSRRSVAPVVAPYGFARTVTEPKPGSYAARNTGARHARGDLLAFTDADCQPRPDWLEQAERVFAGDRRTAAIGGRIELGVSNDRALAELYELVFTPFPQAQFVEIGRFAATANLVARATVFQSVGPFDEDLLSSGDREWGNRLFAAGFELRYSPECVVLHPARRTVRSLIGKRRRIAGGTLKFGDSDVEDASRVPLRRLHPPRRTLASTLLFDPGRYGLGRIEGLGVFVLAAFLVAVRITESARVRLGWKPVR